MTITSSGPRCDVCGSHIFPWDEIFGFKMQGIERELDAHGKCRQPVLDACEKQDVALLPDGPLRRAFESAKQQEKAS